MTINFGVLPVRCSFTLSSDADFYQGVKTADDSDFPVDTELEIRWLDKDDNVLDTWPATVAGATAQFRESAATVASLLAGDTPVQGRVFYMDGAGGPELLVAQGVVRDISP